MLGVDLGIDFGTSNIRIYAGNGIVLNEPSVIAVDKQDGHLIACGQEAYEMLGRSPDSILVIRPLTKGVISEYDYAEQMLRHFVRKVCAYKIIKPRAAVSIPACATEVEHRSAVEAVSAAGIRRVVLVEESVAAAIGAGLDIGVPCGSMVVDIGGGTTDVAVLSLKGVASSLSIRVGGNDMDEAIVRYMRNRYNHVVGLQTAEQIKKTIGCTILREGNPTMDVRGRDGLSGLPRIQKVNAKEIMDAIEDIVKQIMTAIQHVLETTHPELVSDILESGITMTGGGSLLYGLNRRIFERTGVQCTVAENPELCVALGTGKTLKYVGVLSTGLYDINQFSYRLSDSADA